MKRSRIFTAKVVAPSVWSIAAWAAAACAPMAAHSASLEAFAGVVGGAGNGSIAGGCTTYGPPAELAFFSGVAAGLQVLGGNAACGYSGGWTNLITTTGTTPLLASASLPPTVLGNPAYAESFDGTASARASYGSLGAIAHGQYSGSPVSYSGGTTIAASVGAASFSDTLTASVSHTYTDLSSSGFVRYRFSVDGGMTTPAAQVAYFGGEALTDFRIQHDGGPIFDQLLVHAYAGNTGTASGAGAAGGGWTFGLGTASGGGTFESGLFAIDLLKPWDFKAGLIVNAYGNADADFYNTAKIVGIDLFDSTGQQITEFGLSSASGASYVGAVPEPASIALMLAGLAGLMGLHAGLRVGRRGA